MPEKPAKYSNIMGCRQVYLKFSRRHYVRRDSNTFDAAGAPPLDHIDNFAFASELYSIYRKQHSQ
jgi:hypothetical protein